MADDRDRGRERDLVLAPNEFAFISDETKGNINVYVGPHKTSLANTDRPVIFDPATKRFERTTLERATQIMSVAPEGWYLVLKNPARDGSHPRTGALNNLPELEVGRKVNVPGPVSFAQWPGQMVRVLQGHQLRSNHYVVVRVYDEEAAKANWGKAVMKPQQGADEPSGGDAPIRPADLTMGTQLVIRGTEVAFYIPPTGIEVVRDAGGQYVREAVTLERLEYCILLDEDGNKRFIRGPAVVFPRPTEKFVERGGATKFKAIELNENSGIYVKVIAPYEENGQAFKVGDELFVTGKEQMIYFPRPEHAIIKYGDREIHYAIAIPAGEARYVLDRHSGQIRLHRGPSIFLPDPRREVVVRRVLDDRQVALWFPGNQEAVAVNKSLRQMLRGGRDFVAAQDAAPQAPAAPAAEAKAKTDAKFAGDELARQPSYTPPRSIVLDTRYDGAVSIELWAGYAALVVKRTGERHVLVGPTTHLLEYDETLQAVELSTGTPKRDEPLFRTAYLRVLHNKVSDLVEVETRDLVRVRLGLSYRVSFEGEPSKWFDVENYVKFLTDHLRSLLRHAVKQRGIEAFYGDAAGVVRDVVLGVQGENGKRPGRGFTENGMRVYDVEVLEVTIDDASIANMLVAAQKEVVRQALAVAAEQRKVTYAREAEKAKQELLELESTTKQRAAKVALADLTSEQEVRLAKVAADASARAKDHAARVADQEALGAIHRAELDRTRAQAEQDLALEKRALDQRLEELAGEVRAVVAKAQAVSPELVAALQAFSDRALAEKMAQSMAPLAILGGESVSEVLSRLLRGTPLAKALGALPAGDGGEAGK